MAMAELQDAQVHHMRVTSAGQISLPAEVRRRWGASRVKITDEGGRLVIEPASDHPLSAAIGLLAGGRGASEGLLAERAAERERDGAAWARRIGGDAT
jgi:AbrB family looped-hinge helix DNA binding protein